MLIEILNWAKYNPKDTGYWWRMEACWALDPAISMLPAAGKLIWVGLMAFACQCNGPRYDLDMDLLCKLYGVDMDSLSFTLNHLKARGKIAIPTLRGRYTRTNVRTYERTLKGEHQSGSDADPGSLLGKSNLPKLSWTDWDMTAAVWLQKAVLLHNPAARKVRKANLDRWANDFRVMREQDELADEVVKEAMQRLFEPNHPEHVADPFWRIQIQSPAALRKHWDKVTAAINNPKAKSGYAI
jgi:hypothetical protein